MDKLIDEYKVFILDFDGTLWNGSARIGGVHKVVLELYKQDKLVLYFTNGGWCSLQYNFDSIVSWVKREMATKDAEFVLSKLKLTHVYNTAQLAAKFLLKTIEPSKKVLVMGNEGTLDEIQI
jgi:ribonucleotide monophosphatase NagD (HAD superfamily)